MRKMRVTLVILLLLAFMAASSAASAKIISPGDTLSTAKSRAVLQDIEKKLMTGNADIAKASQELSDYTMYKARQSIANATKAPAANKTTTTARPPVQGSQMPMSGIGDAIKTLGNIHMSIKPPIAIAKSINMPRLAVFK